jgi:anti-sigma factor RsiW
MIIDHPPFEQLSAFADGDLAPEASAAVERHLAACVSCRAELVRLRAVLDRAAALPPAIEPPADAWNALRYRLRKQGASAPPGVRWARQWGLRAAAALVLVAGSSSLTVLALRGRTGAQVGGPRHAPAPLVVPATVPAVQAVERSYADVVDELTATLRAQRGALAPTTVATLERTLGVIDEAIAEARAALAADPGNDVLLDVLSANYEQKVQLLRRASELPGRT